MKLIDELKDIIETIYSNLFSSYMKINIAKRYKTKKHKNINSDYQLSKKQKKQIDIFYKKNYGKRIIYDAHREYASLSRAFYKEYVPEFIFISEISHYFNIYADYVTCFSDKNVMTLIAEIAGIKTPVTLFSRVKGHYRNKNNQIITEDEFYCSLYNLGKVFCKPSIDSSAGQCCFVANFVDGNDLMNNHNVKESIGNLGRDFVIQKVIECHSSIKKIYPNSCNTFRVVTYFWKGKIYTMPSFLRIGRNNSFVDNVCAGGLYVGIDDEGNLNKHAYTEFGEIYDQHDNTGVVFDGYCLKQFPEVLKAAIKLHSYIPQIGVVFWDFTLGKNGEPVFIEGNFKYGGIWANQIASGKPAFGERTADILNWTKKMKHASLKKRKTLLYENVFKE